MSIGQTLKNARTLKKMTIGDVSSAIRINKKYIQALEDGNFLVLPSLVYAKGFLKAYSEFIGLDSRPLIDELLEFYRLKEEPKKASVIRPREKRKFDMSKMEIPRFEMPKIEFPKFEMPKFKLPKFEFPRLGSPKMDMPKFNAPRVSMPKINLPGIRLPKIEMNLDFDPRYIVFGLIALLFVFFMAYEYGLSKKTYHARASVATVEAQAVEKAPAKTVKAIEKKIIGPVQPDKHSGVKIIAVSRSWVTINSDGAQVYNGIIEAGHWVNYRGREVKVMTGNASGVKVVLNGVDQGLMGTGDQVSEKTFYPYQ
jgi:hypothetical protein